MSSPASTASVQGVFALTRPPVPCRGLHGGVPRLHIVTDTRGGRDPLDDMRGALSAWARAIQVRGKHAATAAGATYLGVGPAFATRTKDGLSDPLGPAGIAAAAATTAFMRALRQA